MIPVKFTKEQSDFIRGNGSNINDKWFHLPYWFKEVGENIFELHGFESLPSEIKEIIISHRNPVIIKTDSKISLP